MNTCRLSRNPGRHSMQAGRAADAQVELTISYANAKATLIVACCFAQVAAPFNAVACQWVRTVCCCRR